MCFDARIIGAGAAVITLVKNLNTAKIQVFLFESGGLISKQGVQNLSAKFMFNEPFEQI